MILEGDSTSALPPVMDDASTCLDADRAGVTNKQTIRILNMLHAKHLRSRAGPWEKGQLPQTALAIYTCLIPRGRLSSGRRTRSNRTQLKAQLCRR